MAEQDTQAKCCNCGSTGRICERCDMCPECAIESSTESGEGYCEHCVTPVSADPSALAAELAEQKRWANIHFKTIGDMLDALGIAHDGIQYEKVIDAVRKHRAKSTALAAELAEAKGLLEAISRQPSAGGLTINVRGHECDTSIWPTLSDAQDDAYYQNDDLDDDAEYRAEAFDLIQRPDLSAFLTRPAPAPDKGEVERLREKFRTATNKLLNRVEYGNWSTIADLRGIIDAALTPAPVADGVEIVHINSEHDPQTDAALVRMAQQVKDKMAVKLVADEQDAARHGSEGGK